MLIMFQTQTKLKKSEIDCFLPFNAKPLIRPSAQPSPALSDLGLGYKYDHDYHHSSTTKYLLVVNKWVADYENKSKQNRKSFLN